MPVVEVSPESRVISRARLAARVSCDLASTHVWMAIGQKAWAPKISSPPIRTVRMSGPALHFGVK